MEHYRLKTSKRRVRLSLTRWGRLAAALQAAGIAFLVALVIMTILYLPDFIGDYSQREGGFQSFFFVYFLGAALLVAVIAGVMKFLANARWELDMYNGVAHWWTKTGFGREYDDQLDAELIDRIVLQDRSWFLGADQVLVVATDGATAVIASSRTQRDELETIEKTCQEILASESS